MVMAKYNWRTPVGANQLDHTTNLGIDNLVGLQCGWRRFVEAVAAQLMCGFHFTHKILFKLSKYTEGDLATFVLLFFCAPIFKAHTLLFEFVYFRRQRRLFFLSGESDGVGLNQLGVHLRDCGNNFVVIGEAIRRLKKGE